MEAVGVALDREALAALDVEFRAEIERLEGRSTPASVTSSISAVPKQLEQVLFCELDLPEGQADEDGLLHGRLGPRGAPGGPPDGRRPARVADLHEAPLDLRRGAADPASPSDGRLHTTFHQAVAATGRLSSSDPNLQNIPIRTPLGRRIRRAFVAGGPDVTLVAADYSQIELRILAHVSGDEHLRDAFARGADIHRETAARVLHKAPEEVTADERSMAKMVNFGIAYGMSDFGLSSRAGIPRKEAQDFINTYFATYSGISYYMLHIKETGPPAGLRRRRSSAASGRSRSSQARNPSLRARRRADGDQHADPGHGRGHHQDRDDPAGRAAGRRRVPRPAAPPGPRRAAARGAARRGRPARRRSSARRWKSALALDVPLTVDVKVGDDWESMTPLTRADAVLAEADEPLEAPLAGA